MSYKRTSFNLYSYNKIDTLPQKKSKKNIEIDKINRRNIRRNTVREVFEPLNKKTRKTNKISLIILSIKNITINIGKKIIHFGKIAINRTRNYLNKNNRRRSYLDNVSSIRNKKTSGIFDTKISRKLSLTNKSEYFQVKKERNGLYDETLNVSSCRAF